MLKPSKLTYEYSILDYSVVDGDTVGTLLDMGFDTYSQRSCRLYGIDVPESRTYAGRLVTQVVQAWFSKQERLLAISISKDKYDGRYVGLIRGSEPKQVTFTYVTDLIITQKLGYPYFGGTKRIWVPEELDRVAELAVATLNEYGVTPISKAK